MTLAYQLTNIRYRYDQHVALSLPELVIQAGTTTALVGSNGSGKSTLLNLLALLTFPEHGNVQLFENTITSENACHYRKQIGFLTQKPYLLGGSVLDNLNFALKLQGIKKAERQSQAMTILEQLDIVHLCEQQTNKISGGELQKVALARALLLDPDVLLLDEPFNNLDQQSSQTLEHFLVTMGSKPGKTLVFSTHDRLQGLALAGNVISLVSGKSVATPLVNLFQGTINSHCFDTGKISIFLPDHIDKGTHISIDPAEIVISNQPLSSSIRNNFCGRITTITEEKGNVRITVAAGERFHALITHKALDELNLKLGSETWINFKSNCVTVF